MGMPTHTVCTGSLPGSVAGWPAGALLFQNLAMIFHVMSVCPGHAFSKQLGDRRI